MRKTVLFSMLILIVVFSWQNLSAQKANVTKNIKLTFENVATGKLPAHWKVEATRQRGPLATWQVIKDTTAPSGSKVLALTSPNHHYDGTFNICWTNSINFLNGEIKVMFKANTGRVDEGGGIMWRVRNKNNYYVSRYNPLEDNFRLYYVKNGVRRMIASAKVKIPKGKWYEQKIVQKGNHIYCYLNGKKYLDAKTNTFRNAGGVGLWTKSDAVTSFDNFEVKFYK